MRRRKNEIELYRHEYSLLKKSAAMLENSYERCKRIGIKSDYTVEELEKFEALTSRFARTSDIIVQKIFRLIDMIELEPNGTIIDRINRAERRGLINSADTFKNIRRIRNDIAHEYVPSVLEEIFIEVFELTPYLLDCVKSVEKYGQKNKWLGQG